MITLKKQKIAILGASYLQKPLILKAKKLGLETHCFSWEEGATEKHLADYFYPISVLDKEKILIKCREIKIDGIVSIASDIVVPIWAYIAENMNLNSNSINVAIKCANKYLMRKELSHNRINCPFFVHINTTNEVKIAKLVEGIVFPAIVKPVDRSGSRGVVKVYTKPELQKALYEAQKISLIGEVIVEEFIEGNEYSVEAISNKGKHKVLAITEKITTGAPFFVELEHHQPANLNPKITEGLKEFAIKCLDVLGIREGASHSEIFITKNDELFIIEVGARMGGDFIGSSLTNLSTGIDFLKLVIDIALNNSIDMNFKFQNNKSGIVFLTDRTLTKFFLKNKDLNCIEYHEGFIPIKMLKSSADRKGYYIYQSKNTK